MSHDLPGQSARPAPSRVEENEARDRQFLFRCEQLGLWEETDNRMIYLLRPLACSILSIRSWRMVDSSLVRAAFASSTR